MNCALIRSVFFVLALISLVSNLGADCFFLREDNLVLPSGMTNVRIEEFVIYANDLQAINRQQETLQRSVHFLKTQLGWKFPYTRKDANIPLLEVYFVPASREFTGTVRPGPVVVLNESVLASQDFSQIWIHYLAHAAGMMYRNATFSEDTWFFEATAGWMEGQFAGKPSRSTRIVQQTRQLRSQVPLDHPAPDLALGASLFLDGISRPYPDVIRQTWEQWSSSSEEKAMDVLARVLQLNHLPTLKSYVLNYFLRNRSGSTTTNTMDIVLQPYSATVIHGTSEGMTNGGIRLSFTPRSESDYSTALVYYAGDSKEGIVTIKDALRGPWSARIPFAGMSRYRMIVVNASKQVIEGFITRKYDPAIPAVIDFFRATPNEEGGMQLEWKTSRENGVAFWNLYRTQNGTKERLNSLPIPASIDSPSGLNYMFIDYTAGNFYSLEAVTGEGFPSVVATAGTQGQN